CWMGLVAGSTHQGERRNARPSGPEVRSFKPRHSGRAGGASGGDPASAIKRTATFGTSGHGIRAPTRRPEPALRDIGRLARAPLVANVRSTLFVVSVGAL